MPRKKTKKRPRKAVLKPTKRYRNRRLNIDLDEAYRDFCGIGLHATRERLAEIGSPIATAFLQAIDIERVNRRAKRKMGQDSAAKLYREKRQAIERFITLCLEHEFELYREDSRDEPGQPHVLYVYLPNCEQISWHCRVDERFGVPEHSRSWDGKRYSTLKKLEMAITKRLDL